MRSVINEIPAHALMCIARDFTDPENFDPTRNMVHVRNGVLVATTGRMLLRVESLALTEDHETRDATDGTVMAFHAENEVLVGGMPYVVGEFMQEVEAAAAKNEEQAEKDREWFAETVRNDSVVCPCCGIRIYVHDGVAEYAEAYIRENTPTVEPPFDAVRIVPPEPDARCLIVSISYIRLALRTATAFGGDVDLLFGTSGDVGTVILRGDGFEIIIAGMRPYISAVYDIHVPAAAIAGFVTGANPHQ